MDNFEIFLPGLDSQYKFLISRAELKDKSVLVLGSESAAIAERIAENSGKTVSLIVEDYESLLNSKLKLNDNPYVHVALMDFDITDFDKNSFDVIYAQAAISNSRRNKIVKEMKRILKQKGLFCVGEIATNKAAVPRFIQNVFDNSDIVPLQFSRLNDYYSERNFKELDHLNLTFTLKDYYARVLSNLNLESKNMTDKEKSYYKKLLNKIGHEAKVYLNHGGDRFFGFIATILELE